MLPPQALHLLCRKHHTAGPACPLQPASNPTLLPPCPAHPSRRCHHEITATETPRCPPSLMFTQVALDSLASRSHTTWGAASSWGPGSVRQDCPSEDLAEPAGGEDPSETPHCVSPTGGIPGLPHPWAFGGADPQSCWCWDPGSSPTPQMQVRMGCPWESDKDSRQPLPPLLQTAAAFGKRRCAHHRGRPPSAPKWNFRAGPLTRELHSSQADHQPFLSSSPASCWPSKPSPSCL